MEITDKFEVRFKRTLHKKDVDKYMFKVTDSEGEYGVIVSMPRGEDLDINFKSWSDFSQVSYQKKKWIECGKREPPVSSFTRSTDKKKQKTNPAKSSDSNSSDSSSGSALSKQHDNVFTNFVKHLMKKCRGALHFSPDHALNSQEDILAYKVVSFYVGNSVIDRISALLTMIIPGDRATIYNAESGFGTCSPKDIQPKIKYCTNLARIEGVQFLGDPKQVKQALLAFQVGTGKLISYYKQTRTSVFEYELHRESVEPDAGRGCGGGSCGKGIYFFIDPASVLRYWAGNTHCSLTDPTNVPIITRKFTHPRGLRVAVAHPIGGKVSDDQIEHHRQDLELWLREKADGPDGYTIDPLSAEADDIPNASPMDVELDPPTKPVPSK